MGNYLIPGNIAERDYSEGKITHEEYLERYPEEARASDERIDSFNKSLTDLDAGRITTDEFDRLNQEYADHWEASGLREFYEDLEAAGDLEAKLADENVDDLEAQL